MVLKQKEKTGYVQLDYDAQSSRVKLEEGYKVSLSCSVCWNWTLRNALRMEFMSVFVGYTICHHCVLKMDLRKLFVGPVYT